jgi:hypothetical protein
MLAEPQAALKPEQLKLAVQAGTIGLTSDLTL